MRHLRYVSVQRLSESLWLFEEIKPCLIDFRLILLCEILFLVGPRVVELFTFENLFSTKVINYFIFSLAQGRCFDTPTLLRKGLLKLFCLLFLIHNIFFLKFCIQDFSIIFSLSCCIGFCFFCYFFSIKEFKFLC